MESQKLMRIPIVLMSAVFTLLAFSANSGAATIYGYVYDASSREPLPVATVVVEGTDRGTATNLDGYFVIDHISPGKYTLLVSLLGYETKEHEVVIYEDDGAALHIEIKPTSVKLEEVEVTVEKKETRINRQSPVTSAVPIRADVIRYMPSLGGEMDVMRALQTIPGVKASSDISSALYVRGGSADQTLILMDHNPVYNPNHLFGLFSTFNADAVKHLDLMKGAFPAEYGGRSGSVLEVVTKDGNRKETNGLFSLGLISARLSLEGPIKKIPFTEKSGSYAFSYRRTYMDYIIDYMRNSQDMDLPDYHFYDGNAKVNLDLTDHTTLSLAGYMGDDVLDFDFGPDDARGNIYMSWGNRTFTSRLRHALGSKMFLTVGAALSRYRSKWAFENEGVLFDRARGRLYDYSARSDLEILGVRDHQIKLGIQYNGWDSEFMEENEDRVFVDVDKFTSNVSLYIQDSWRAHTRLEIMPGFRIFYHERGEQVTYDPRLSFVYRQTENLRFKLGGGRYSQYINVLTLGEAFSAFDVWFPIDETLNPTYTDQVVLGVEYDTKGYEFTNEVYYTDMTDVVHFNPNVDEGEVAADAFIQGDGDAYGVEWMLRKKSGRLTGWLGYTLAWTHRQFPDSPINQGMEFYPKWDRRHDFIIVTNYKLTRSWEMSGSWRYNTGQGYTQGLGIRTWRMEGHDPSYEGNLGRTVYYGSKNNYRLPADHRLDISFIYSHLIFGKEAKLNISVFNAYSRRAYWQRIVDTSENPVDVTDLKLLPIVPLLSYEVRF